MNTRPCHQCKHHKSRANKHPGKLIPGASGKCTLPGGLCDPTPQQPETTMTERSNHEIAADIVGRPGVQNRIATRPGGDQAGHPPWGRGAREPGQRGLNPAAGRGRTTPGGDWRDPALAAVSSRDPMEAATNAYHAIYGWLGGPANVPNDIRLSWAPKPGKTKKAVSPATAEAVTPEVYPAQQGGDLPATASDPIAELEASRNEMAAIDRAVMDAEEVYRDLGRIDAATFYETVSGCVIAQTFQKIKKNKRYMGLPYIDKDGKAKHVSSLEEFCEVKLGKSYKRCHELAQSLHLLGPALYESAERIGFRAKDYRALKALPEADQEVVRQALEAEDKGQVLDILQDLAERHAAEREAAKKESEELKADLAARDKLLADKTRRLDETSMELSKLKSLPPDANVELKLAREKEAVEALDKVVVGALAELNKLLMQVDTVVSSEDVAQHTKQYAVQTVQMFCQDLQINLANYGIPVDFEEMVNPEWMRDRAKQDHEEGVTGDNGAW